MRSGEFVGYFVGALQARWRRVGARIGGGVVITMAADFLAPSAGRAGAPIFAVDAEFKFLMQGRKHSGGIV